MSFYHPLFLFALAGMLVPIILHLLNRRHAKLMEWGATQFLLGSLVSRRRRLLLEEMMLLAMRCLLCALAVLVVARPIVSPDSKIAWAVVLPLLLLGSIALGVGTAFWQERIWRWRLWAAGALMILGALVFIVWEHKDQLRNRVGDERDVAIIIDGSSSMRLAVDGKSNFDRAVEEARLLVGSLNRNATVTFVLAGAAPKVITERPLTQRDEIERVLSELKPLDGSSELRPAIHAAWLRLQSGPHAAKQIVVFTDQQRTGWDVDDATRWEETVAELKGEGPPPQLYARSLPLPETVRNVMVTRLEPARNVVGTDRSVTIECQVKNTGTVPISAAKVDLSVDGEAVESRSYGRLDPGNTATVSFSHRFDKPGAHVVEARTGADDDLAEDNVRLAAIRVMDRLPVLIVGAGTEPEFLMNSSAYAQLALAPGASESPGEGGSFPPLVQTTVVDPLNLKSQSDLNDYRVVILTDVPQLAEPDAKRIAEYVAKGGSLWVAPGSRALPNFYNRWQRAEGNGLLMPAQLKERREIMGEEKPVQMAISTLSHPALRFWADMKPTAEGTALFRGYWKLAAADGGSLPSGGNLTSGDPLLVESQVGAGTVVLMAASLDVAGSNFATRRPNFPMFMHEMVNHLADIGRTGLTFEAGQEPTLALVGETGQNVAFRYWKPGLKGEYFANADFNLKPEERMDARLDFDWQSAAPLPALKPEKFGVRWTGAIVPEKTETVKLLLTGQGAGQLWLDDKQLINRPGPGTAEATVNLQAGSKYRLRVEETKTTNLAAAKLEWDAPSHGRQVIPESSLAHSVTAAKSDRTEDAYELTGPGESGDIKKQIAGEVRDGKLTIKLPAVPAPGIYYLKPPESLLTELATTQDDQRRIPIAMAPAPAEADLAKMESADWDTLKSVAALQHPQDADAIKKIAQGEPFGQEMWKYLALAALVILIAEVALTRWIAIQRQVTADPVGDFEFRTRTGDAAYLQRFATPGGRPMAGIKQEASLV